MTKEQLIVETAKKLLKVSNNVTTLEIKLDLIANHSEYYWSQDEVSVEMSKWQNSNPDTLTFVDQGRYKIYSYKEEPVDIVTTKVIEAIRLVLDPTTIVEVTSTFKDLDIDLIDLVNVTISLEDTFSIVIPDQKTIKFKTVQSYIDCVNSLIAAKSAKKDKVKKVKSKPVLVKKKISKRTAIEMIKNSKGMFFNVKFVKKDGQPRSLTGKFSKMIPDLGYIEVKEFPGGTFKQVNTQTMHELTLANYIYKIN